MRLYVRILLLSVVSLPLMLSAARVTVYDAECAVRAFASEGLHFVPGLSSFPRSVREHTASDGSRFFSARMCGGGTVFLSGDDELEPVVAFSSADIDVEDLDTKSPLYALLVRDSRVRRVTPDAKEKWTRLLASGDSLTAYPYLLSVLRLSAGTFTPSDVRVPALVETKWDQKVDSGGNRCYNLSTPGNAPCGCVATSMSQVMRYHRWPDVAHPVAQKTVRCSYNGVATNLTMQGGVYDWTMMPAGTSDDPIDLEAQRQAIGGLASDAGISAGMAYSADGSESTSVAAQDAFVEVWHYGQAVFLYDYAPAYGCMNGMKGSASRMRTLQSAIFSNLDAGCPVMLGIFGNGGHSVVADGYGYDGGADYVHLNMGWSGSCDLWYNLPTIGSDYGFRSVDDLVYNIFPTNGTACAAFSGRIVNAEGAAVSDARVTIVRSGTDDVAARTASSSSGVYGAILEGGVDYDVVAVSSDGQSSGRVSRISLALPMTSATLVDGCKRAVVSTGVIGNSWGNDIVLGTDVRRRATPTNFYVSASRGVDAPERGTSDAPYATIQYAITNGQILVDGDVIKVMPGLYYGCVETPATSISIVSTDGPPVTFIDGEGRDCCYDGSANQQNLLSGFTVTNGAYYGGIYYGTATDCVIVDCRSIAPYDFAYGGGAYAADLSRCVIHHNDADCGGGAAGCRLVDCLVYENSAYFGGGASQSVLTNCLVSGNCAYGFVNWRRDYDGGRGGGVYESDIVNCTLADNYADFYGGGAYLHERGQARNSVVCGNVNGSGGAYGNDVYGNHYWTMSNSLSDVDAGYRDAAHGDYRVTPSSPAVDAGSMDFVSVLHDLDGTNRVWGSGVDIGCYEYHLPSGITDPTGIGVAAALAAEGFRDEYAAAVKTPKDYAYLTEWTAKRGLSLSALNASSTGFISPALAADGLLELDSTNIVLQALTSVSDGGWRVALSLPGYDRSRINVPLLKAAIGIVGSSEPKGPYSSDDLSLVVTPSATNILVAVTPPNATNYYLKATVR